jgi:NADH-quinone oxidoreductase subunit J
MGLAFYIAAVVALVATVMVITRREAVHALLYLVVSLLAVAVVFFTLGAPFIAALEVIVYAGAIMVLFIFVVMMLNLGEEGRRRESALLSWKAWLGPGILAGILLVQLVGVIGAGPGGIAGAESIAPKEVGMTLFGPYLIGVELGSILLLAGLIGAYHLGRRENKAEAE